MDLRKLGWEEPKLWRAVLKEYPYGLHWRNHPDANLDRLDQKLRHLSDCDLAVIRGDWFIVHATQPKLYYTLLQLPATAGELERDLKVHVERNILQGEVKRGGFATSGVSGQNRMVERHDSAYGAYWKSYDFKPARPNGNLPRYPLGPKFKGNEFSRQAFEHDGGEIIFSLPNGLQGYFLVDAVDKRIDEGPIQVVRDNLMTSGTPAIVAGLSCMACHKSGTIPFKDQIREGSALRGEALRAVQRLYPPQKEMSEALKKDEKRFTDALEEACGPFLRTAPELKEKPIGEFAEPVAEIARLYGLVDLNADMVAAELWLEKGAAGLKARLEIDDELDRLGLGVLRKEGGALKRNDWEAFSEGVSLFHEVARRVKAGTPLLP